MARHAAVAVVAVAVFLILRTHVAQRYLIPSRSMEPTLHGDPQRGDIVLVDKLGAVRSHDTAALQRFDVVVLRDPDRPSGDPLVKRVVSTGDEMLRIADGDLFVRPLTGGPWQRVQKDPLALRDLRFTFYEHCAGRTGVEPPGRYLAGPLAGDGTFELRASGSSLQQALAAATNGDGTGSGQVLRSVESIDVSFLDADGRRNLAGERRSNDIGIELDLTLTADCAGLALALVVDGRALAVACGRDGSLLWQGAADATPAQGPPLGSCVALAFGYLDGRLFLEIDGVLAALVPCALPAEAESERNTVRVAAAGHDLAARAHRVRLFHDVYYHPENRPHAGIKEYRVEPHEVFLLGDNTFDSTDSRRRGPFAADGILGRPLAVIGPWRRARWLPR